MALHTQLPIYKVAYDLLRLSLLAKANMRRDFKNSLGTRIHDECIEILLQIARANQCPDAEKPPFIKAILQSQGTVEFLLRVCNDQQLITPKVWAQSVELLQRMGTQGGGWLKWANQAARQQKAPAA
ncbi:MAG: four helix bundle protein [Ramlibacter sp.]|nr:four helix bundle protein [Ramlibacter sp.]